VKDSEYVLISQPAFGHETTSAAVMPYLCSGQKIVFVPGNASTIALRDIFSGKNVFLAETNTLPYGCRIKHENGLEVHVSVLPGQISLGAFPSGAVDEFSDFSELINRRVVKANTALEAALNNPNPLVHPTGVLLNAGGIEQFDELNFYKGYTSSVMRVLGAKDRERLAIGSKLDYNLLKYEDFGGKDINGNLDSFINCGMKAELGKPAINGRYITEDVPYGLSLWASLADLVGVDVPIMKAEIKLASTMNSTDYFKSGRTLESLGFHNAKKQDVEAVLSGYK
jgi:opine dehydrogenase